MRPQIQEQIRLELTQQIRAAVEGQITEHLPVSLQDQAEESKRQLIEVRNSLLNRWVDLVRCWPIFCSRTATSLGTRAYYFVPVTEFLAFHSEARRSNATLRSTNLDDPLAPVVKANGEESALAPQTLRQLFSYDSTQHARLLLATAH
jgi:hypothetical protein